MPVFCLSVEFFFQCRYNFFQRTGFKANVSFLNLSSECHFYSPKHTITAFNYCSSKEIYSSKSESMSLYKCLTVCDSVCMQTTYSDCKQQSQQIASSPSLFSVLTNKVAFKRQIFLLGAGRSRAKSEWTRLELLQMNICWMCKKSHLLANMLAIKQYDNVSVLCLST